MPVFCSIRSTACGGSPDDGHTVGIPGHIARGGSAREEIALTVKGCFREHHYLPVETPLLEDKGSLEEGGRIADTPFKLFDDDGRLLVVRPDNTLPIGAWFRPALRARPICRCAYAEAPVVRQCRRNAGGSRQFTQLGFSLSVRAIPRAMSRLSRSWPRRCASWRCPMRIIAGSVRPFKELLAACEVIASWLPRHCVVCTPTTSRP